MPDIPVLVQHMTVTALDEAKEQMLEGKEVIPFTALMVKSNVFLENHPGEDPDECFAAARRTVGAAQGADAYAFCYDGYLETDAGVKDALIAEGGLPGDPTAYAVAYLYEIKRDAPPVFEEEPLYVGPAPNFMINLKKASQYDDDQIDPIYLEEDEEVEEEEAE